MQWKINLYISTYRKLLCYMCSFMECMRVENSIAYRLSIALKKTIFTSKYLYISVFIKNNNFYLFIFSVKASGRVYGL